MEFNRAGLTELVGGERVVAIQNLYQDWDPNWEVRYGLRNDSFGVEYGYMRYCKVDVSCTVLVGDFYK